MYFTAQANLACSRGALDVATRRFDPRRPSTWEFSAFSQNGEDGIIDHLLSLVTEPNRLFLEIGASNGLQNNTAFLAYVKKYEGVMIEGDASVAAKAQPSITAVNPGVTFLARFVAPDDAPALVRAARRPDIDFFSLDIDSFDLHVARELLDHGLRPKVVCVEYNSAFGPERAATVPYTAGFDYLGAHPSRLYYGASVMAWRRLFEERGYQFVTVESRGVNAFFVDPGPVDVESLEGLEGAGFAENLGQLARYPGGWTTQAPLIAHLPVVEVGQPDAAAAR